MRSTWAVIRQQLPLRSAVTKSEDALTQNLRVILAGLKRRYEKPYYIHKSGSSLRGPQGTYEYTLALHPGYSAYRSRPFVIFPARMR